MNTGTLYHLAFLSLASKTVRLVLLGQIFKRTGDISSKFEMVDNGLCRIHFQEEIQVLYVLEAYTLLVLRQFETLFVYDVFQIFF